MRRILGVLKTFFYAEGELGCSRYDGREEVSEAERDFESRVAGP